MSSITVCVRLRPLSSKERRDHGDAVCVQSIVDSEHLLFKDEREIEFLFRFDKVFCDSSEQAHVFEFLALPIVRDAVKAINGTILTYGQTGAGKTYTMEGPSILVADEQKRGLLPRVVDELFDCIKSSEGKVKHTVRLSMVEIYMEKVRDLFDLSKDNIQIEESKAHGIVLTGATEISVFDPVEALRTLSIGIANRTVGETEMNKSSSRSHCIYIFTVQELNEDDRLKTGKLILVDLAGSEKAEKTGAEGKVLEEANTVNKSLSSLGNVINALTRASGKANNIPFRDSKLTWLLQDALGGNSRTALLCCCSPSPLNALETLSTLQFGKSITKTDSDWSGKTIVDHDHDCYLDLEAFCSDEDDDNNYQYNLAAFFSDEDAGINFQYNLPVFYSDEDDAPNSDAFDGKSSSQPEPAEQSTQGSETSDES